MKFRKSVLPASIATALLFAAAAQAQGPSPQGAAPDPQQTQATTGQNQTGSSQQNVQTLETIQVIGIPASIQASIETKRNANAIVDAITSTDLGKFAATNAAEALQQIPGVTLDHSIPGTQRVSIDGMDPSLNMTLLDGHPVAQAMWLFGDSPNRGFNYSLLPPEIIQSIEIFKSPEANLPAGSLGGTVYIHTFEPLTTPANVLTGSVGYNYNSMVSDGKPNAAIMYSWHNPGKTFGVSVSAQHYEQSGSRQGMENYGYSSVASLNAAALAGGSTAIQDMLNAGTIRPTDMMPNQVSQANFQQTEKRDSVFANFQWRPSDAFETTLSLMYMRDRMANVNSSMYPWASLRPAGITSLTEGPNGIITAGTSIDPAPPCQDDTAGKCGQKAITLMDNFARGSVVKTKGVDWRTRYNGNHWHVDTQAGVSLSRDPITQYLKEIAYGGSFQWNLAQGAQFLDPATANDPSYWADYGWAGNGGALPYRAKDSYGKVDFTVDFDSFLNSLQFGVYWHKHWEAQTEMISGGGTPMTLDQIGYGGLTDLNGASAFGFFPSFVTHVQTAGFNAIRSSQTSQPGFPGPYDFNVYTQNSWNVNQRNEEGYAQANFGNDTVFGNVGVRFVRTTNNSFGWNVPGSCVAADSWSCEFPPGFGLVGQSQSHNDWLPAINVAWNAAPNVVVRGAASESIAYAPYNQLAPFFTANDTVLTATAGNPNLDPYKSVNFDGSVEWYFTNKAMLAGSIFYKNVINYIVNAATMQSRINGSWTLPGYLNSTGNAQIAAGLCTTAGVCQYDVTAPVDGGHANVRGFTVSYQQAFDSGLGMRAAYTYSNATTRSHGALPYNSKNSVSLSPYFEKGPFLASLSYNWRSHYLAGGYVAGAPATSVGAFTELDATLGWTFNKNFNITLNALNLLNETYYTYLGSRTQLSAEYKTGRQYVAALHFKFGGAPEAIQPAAATPPPAAPVATPPPPPPPQNVVIDLRGVNFKFDRPKPGEHDIGPTLKPPADASLAILSQAIDTLNRYPQVQIQIDGYTDSIGKPAYNQKLSERRAGIVDAYLTAHGIASSRITAVQGFGAADPVDTNATAAGRQRNRRVEFKVQGEGVQQGQQ